MRDTSPAPIEPDYTSRERLALWILGIFGFAVINTAFLYVVFRRPGALLEVLQDPLAAAFITETFVMLGALAYLLPRWKVTRLHWGWFVGLSLLGSMAFALPVVLLWRPRRDGSPSTRRPPS